LGKSGTSVDCSSSRNCVRSTEPTTGLWDVTMRNCQIGQVGYFPSIAAARTVFDPQNDHATPDFGCYCGTGTVLFPNPHPPILRSLKPF
jgi:hypothetical protein